MHLPQPHLTDHLVVRPDHEHDLLPWSMSTARSPAPRAAARRPHTHEHSRPQLALGLRHGCIRIVMPIESCCRSRDTPQPLVVRRASGTFGRAALVLAASRVLHRRRVGSSTSKYTNIGSIDMIDVSMVRRSPENHIARVTIARLICRRWGPHSVKSRLSFATTGPPGRTGSAPGHVAGDLVELLRLMARLCRATGPGLVAGERLARASLLRRRSPPAPAPPGRMTKSRSPC